MATATLEAPSPESEAGTAPMRNISSPGSTTTRAPRRVVLTGFMGSGKSTVGRLLAAKLGWTFADLDSLIEERTGKTVPELFAEQGEPAFRREETAALAAALRLERTVIALGGGAPETLGNRLLLEQTPATAVVFLAADLPVLLARCVAQGAELRPLLADESAMQKRFAARQPMYRRLASLTLPTSGETAETIAEKLVASLRLEKR